MNMPRGMALLFALFVFTNLATAQIGTSTITGRVTETAGAVAPNVQVSIVQTGTNFKYAGVTNQEGLYRIPSLQLGSYNLTFEAAGFKRLVHDGIEVRTGDVLSMDAVLQLGNVSESIDVTGAAALLETETSAPRPAVNSENLHNLPPSHLPVTS